MGGSESVLMGRVEASHGGDAQDLDELISSTDDDDNDTSSDSGSDSDDDDDEVVLVGSGSDQETTEPMDEICLTDDDDDDQSPAAPSPRPTVPPLLTGLDRQASDYVHGLELDDTAEPLSHEDVVDKIRQRTPRPDDQRATVTTGPDGGKLYTLRLKDGKEGEGDFIVEPATPRPDGHPGGGRRSDRAPSSADDDDWTPVKDSQDDAGGYCQDSCVLL